MGRIIWAMAIDVGKKKTGVAVGQSLTQSGQPLPILHVSASDLAYAHFQPMIHEWRVQTVVIGRPKLQDGKEHPLEKTIIRLAENFTAQGLNVFFADETLTSHEAKKRNPHLKESDSMAAVIMLEEYFASLK